MGRIKVRDLLVRGIIGFKEWEREKKQDIKLNYTIEYNSSLPEKSDRIEDAVDYKIITKEIIRYTEQSGFMLLERLADGILDIIFKDPKVMKAELEVVKPHALRYSESVSFTTERVRNE